MRKFVGQLPMSWHPRERAIYFEFFHTFEAKGCIYVHCTDGESCCAAAEYMGMCGNASLTHFHCVVFPKEHEEYVCKMIDECSSNIFQDAAYKNFHQGDE